MSQKHFEEAHTELAALDPCRRVVMWAMKGLQNPTRRRRIIIENGMSDQEFNNPLGVLLRDMKNTLHAGMPLQILACPWRWLLKGKATANEHAREAPFQATAASRRRRLESTPSAPGHRTRRWHQHRHHDDAVNPSPQLALTCLPSDKAAIFLQPVRWRRKGDKINEYSVGHTYTPTRQCLGRDKGMLYLVPELQHKWWYIRLVV